MTSQWPSAEARKNPRLIACVIHDSIKIYHPIDLIIDTPEFQTLREKKQLGISHYVYPSAEHSRYGHCLGVYHLAYFFIDHQMRVWPELGITSEDFLCVCIAALLHDIGHGPFSHLFDGEFQRRVNAGHHWKHEEISVKILRRIIEKPHIREALEQYLGTGDQFERNITFIEEIIDSKKLDEKTCEWLPKGRGIGKSYLFDIVSNEHDSFDFDKIDYLLRDSYYTGVAIPLNKNSVQRLIENARIMTDPQTDLLRICYPSKVADNLSAAADSRQQLHMMVYQHKTTILIENMIVEALIKANDYIKFKGDDGKTYKLSDIPLNIEAYLKATDSILRQILNSTDEGLEESQRIITAVLERNFMLKMDEKYFSPRDFVEDDQSPSLGYIIKTFKSTIQSYLEEHEYELDKDFKLLTRVLNRGLNGVTHPIQQALFFDKATDEKPFKLSHDWIHLKASGEPSVCSISIYVRRDMHQNEQLKLKTAFTNGMEVTKSKLSKNKSETSLDSGFSSPARSPVNSPVHSLQLSIKTVEGQENPVP